MQVYIVNGAPQCGKTTFEQIIRASNPTYVYIYSSIDFVKEVAKYCGWEGAKTPKDRKFLSDLKQLLIDWNDIPLKKTQEFIRLTKDSYDSLDMEPDNLIFFVDVREPSEIAKFCAAIPNAKSILIHRNEAEKNIQSNASDSNYLDYTYDYVLNNNSTVDDFIAVTEEFYHTVIQGVR